MRKLKKVLIEDTYYLEDIEELSLSKKWKNLVKGNNFEEIEDSVT